MRNPVTGHAETCSAYSLCAKYQRIGHVGRLCAIRLHLVFLLFIHLLSKQLSTQTCYLSIEHVELQNNKQTQKAEIHTPEETEMLEMYPKVAFKIKYELPFMRCFEDGNRDCQMNFHKPLHNFSSSLVRCNTS